MTKQRTETIPPNQLAKEVVAAIAENTPPQDNVQHHPQPAAAAKKSTHQDYVVTVTISHPSTSFTVRASFHLIDPRLCTDPDAFNTPALARLTRFIEQNISI
ncbi:hypothetical protein LCGC14_2338520 [marine sediment metagenome]|uniref:Uncharacterized protein n=1 Tax=marine sediment metagenome TaxID=412755 RepID=A0A0F9F7P9_9ZZZZ